LIIKTRRSKSRKWTPTVGIGHQEGGKPGGGQSGER
jgi:hypothetical protein